jgi:hypothetical protein
MVVLGGDEDEVCGGGEGEVCGGDDGEVRGEVRRLGAGVLA